MEVFLTILGILFTVIFGSIPLIISLKKKKRKLIAKKQEINRNYQNKKNKGKILVDEKKVNEITDIVINIISELAEDKIEKTLIKLQYKKRIEEIINLQKQKKINTAETYLDELEESLSTDSKHLSIIYFLKGNNCYYKKEYHNAISRYDQAITLDINFIEAINNKGVALYNLNEIKTAYSCYKKAIALNENFVDAWNNLGVLLLKTNNTKKAIRCFKQAIKISPKKTESLNNMGVAFYKLKQYSQSLLYLKHALKNSNNSIILKNKRYVEELLNNNTFNSATDTENRLNNQNKLEQEKSVDILITKLFKGKKILIPTFPFKIIEFSQSLEQNGYIPINLFEYRILFTFYQLNFNKKISAIIEMILETVKINPIYSVRNFLQRKIDRITNKESSGRSIGLFNYKEEFRPGCFEYQYNQLKADYQNNSKEIIIVSIQSVNHEILLFVANQYLSFDLLLDLLQDILSNYKRRNHDKYFNLSIVCSKQNLIIMMNLINDIKILKNILEILIPKYVESQIERRKKNDF